jgi:1,4-dihydroxy-2-naphthoate octaprenyltransferase
MTKLFHLARPQFLIASLAIFIIGASWAILLGAPFSLPRVGLSYMIILTAHLSVSFSNDYFDVEVDKHGIPSLFSGGSGILVEHPKLRKPALWIAITLNCCSMGLGILFLWMYSYPFWFLGYVAVSNLLGWFYSAPPLRLAYRGLGELLTAFTSGFLVPGMGYLVLRGYLNSDGMLFTIPLMLYGLAFILTVEIPDMEADRLGYKQTWVARKGRSFGFTAVGALLLAATGFFFYVPYIYSHAFPLDFRLLGFLSLLPLGTGMFGLVKRPADRLTATKLSNWIIITTAVFFILMDVVLVFVATH